MFIANVSYFETQIKSYAAKMSKNKFGSILVKIAEGVNFEF
jgi:hypothetical protein